MLESCFDMTCKTCFEDIFEWTVPLYLIIISCTVTIRCNVCYEFQSCKESTLSLYSNSLPFPLVRTFFTLSALTLHTTLDHWHCYDCRLCLHSYLCVCSSVLMLQFSSHNNPSSLIILSTSVLTVAQAILSALCTVNWTAVALPVCSVKALRTVWSARVVQQQVLCLTAQTVRGIPPAGCTLWVTRLAYPTLRKPAGKDAWRVRDEVMYCNGTSSYVSCGQQEKHLWHSTTHSPLCK